MPKHERLIVNIHENYIASVNASYKDILQPMFENEYLIVKCSLFDKLAIEALGQSIRQEMQEKKMGFEMYAQTLVLQMLMICCRHVIKTA